MVKIGNKNIIIKAILFIISSCIFILSTRAATTTIGQTSELKGINITKRVLNVNSKVSASFYYHISDMEDNPAPISGISENFEIGFTNANPTNGVVEVTSTLDLSSLRFSKVGDYSIKICEYTTSDLRVYEPTNTCFYPMIMVRNEMENGVPTGNLIATLLNVVSDGENKTDAVFETQPKSYLTISKNVTGDMADKEEYFKFKVNINSNNIDPLVISNQDEVVTYNGETITTSSTIIPGEDNYIYLKHGQTVTIGYSDENQIPSGTEVTIEEVDAVNYKTYVNNSEDNNKVYNLSALSHKENENVVAYVNNYEEVTLTGLFIDAAPFIIITIVGFALFVIIRKKHEAKTKES